jgi:hypothetical protein
MARLPTHTRLSSRTGNPAAMFLEPDGRLPGFAQRRLDELIARKKAAGLSAEEDRELREALAYIDAKSAQLLKAGALAVVCTVEEALQ